MVKSDWGGAKKYAKNINELLAGLLRSRPNVKQQRFRLRLPCPLDLHVGILGILGILDIVVDVVYDPSPRHSMNLGTHVAVVDFESITAL
ncbi:unnamed protein product [Sphacelaria rigidula]